MPKRDYLTLEEAARALGQPVSWFTTKICKGELGGKLVGGKWLVYARDLDKLQIDSPSKTKNVTHNFLSRRPTNKVHTPPKSRKVSKEPAIPPKTRQASKPSASHNKARKKVTTEKAIRRFKSTGDRSLIARRLHELNEKIDSLSAQLKKEIIKHDAIKYDQKSTRELPGGLLRAWKAARAERERIFQALKINGSNTSYAGAKDPYYEVNVVQKKPKQSEGHISTPRRFKGCGATTSTSSSIEIPSA